MTDRMPKRIWANRDHYENGWSCDDESLGDGVIDPDGETKYMGGDGVEYIRADSVPDFDKLAERIARGHGVEHCYYAEVDGKACEIDEIADILREAWEGGGQAENPGLTSASCGPPAAPDPHEFVNDLEG